MLFNYLENVVGIQILVAGQCFKSYLKKQQKKLNNQQYISHI